MGASLLRFNWEGFSVVCENVNGLTGACEDSGNADPFCAWLALGDSPLMRCDGKFPAIYLQTHGARSSVSRG